MTPNTILVGIALLLSVLSLVPLTEKFPLLQVALILVCAALLIR